VFKFVHATYACRFGKGSILALVLVAGHALSSAQSLTANGSVATPAPTGRDPAAIALLQRAAISVGGSTTLLAIKDVALDLQVTDLLSNPPVTTQVRYTSFGRAAYKTEVVANNSVQAAGSDGAVFWRDGPDGIETYSVHSAAPIGTTLLPFQLILRELFELNSDIQDLGVDASGAEHLHVVRPDVDPDLGRTEYEIYIDTSSLLVSKVVFYRRAPANLQLKVAVEQRYSDYRTASNVLIPFSVTESINEHDTTKFVLSGASFNVGAQPSDFSPR
jgi:hypothetical protein